MDILTDYVKESSVLNRLLEVSSTDYSTIMHSINTMAFALKFGNQMEFSKPDIKVLGLASLLHDVGKTKIDLEILTASRKLTKQEFEEIQKHCTIGHEILKVCNFKYKEIRLAALEHHEKLDKSGYPTGKTKLSYMSQIIGIIDCYEALTNDDRPYRSAMPPFDALNLIKKDVMSGKFDKSIFEKFTFSLANKIK
jgi:putative nucleotidyltransferase with HDIG domain